LVFASRACALSSFPDDQGAHRAFAIRKESHPMSVRTSLFVLLLPVVVTSVPFSAWAASSVPLGVDLGASGPVTPIPLPSPASQAAAMPHHGMQMAHDGENDVHASGTVNSVNVAGHKVNITHQPIPVIGWPSMTMDFAVAPSVNLASVKPGARVNFSMMRQPDGMYAIQSIAPAGGSP
jgi:Cu/Ag efflux protein CusF